MNHRGSTTDPAVIAANIAGAVPPELSLKWLGESRDRPILAAIATSTLITSTVVACRVASSTRLSKKVARDDRLALVSLSLLLLFTLLISRLITLGVARHVEYLQYITLSPTLTYIAMLNHAAQLAQTASLLMARLSGLAHFHRLIIVPPPTTGVAPRENQIPRILRIATAAVIFGALVQGIRTFSPPVEEAGFGLRDEPLSAAISLLCGLMVFSIPLWMLWDGATEEGLAGQSQKWKGDGLKGLLLVGLLAVGASVARMSLASHATLSLDAPWECGLALTVQTAEVGATLGAVSFPPVKSLWDGWLRGRGDSKDMGAVIEMHSD